MTQTMCGYSQVIDAGVLWVRTEAECRGVGAGGGGGRAGRTGRAHLLVRLIRVLSHGAQLTSGGSGE